MAEEPPSDWATVLEHARTVGHPGRRRACLRVTGRVYGTGGECGVDVRPTLPGAAHVDAALDAPPSAVAQTPTVRMDVPTTVPVPSGSASFASQGSTTSPVVSARVTSSPAAAECVVGSPMSWTGGSGGVYRWVGRVDRFSNSPGASSTRDGGPPSALHHGESVNSSRPRPSVLRIVHPRCCGLRVCHKLQEIVGRGLFSEGLAGRWRELGVRTGASPCTPKLPAFSSTTIAVL